MGALGPMVTGGRRNKTKTTKQRQKDSPEDKKKSTNNFVHMSWRKRGQFFELDGFPDRSGAQDLGFGVFGAADFEFEVGFW